MDVNVTLAAWSNLLIYSAMGVYALAFLIYAFDLFGKQRVAGRQQTAKATGQRLSGTTSGARRGSGARTHAKNSVRRTSRHTSTALLDPEEAPEGSETRVDSADVGALTKEEALADGAAASSGAHGDAASGRARGASAAGSAAGTSAGGASVAGNYGGGTSAALPERTRKLARIATSLTVLALLLHVSAIVTRCLSVMRAPWGNMMEYALMASAIACIVYLVVLKFKDVRYLGTFVTGAVLLVLGLAITVFYTPAAQLVPALQNYWIYIHVPIAIVSTALLSVSAALAVFQMLKAWRETKSPRWLRFMDRLPASDDIETASYRIAAVGFITWTFTLIAGAIWAEIAWGRYWGWDSKEIWTFVVWVVYAAYLHARATRGWGPTKVAILNLVGFLCIVFNFSIVNVFFNGLHAYSGLS